MHGMHHGQEGFDAPLFDRSPPGMPPAFVRSLLQQCAALIKLENLRRGNLLSVRLIAELVEDVAEGETAQVKEKADEAEACRERGL